MPRTLAIDYGAKRTGLAVTDPLGMIASPLDVIPSHALENFLKEYFEKEEVSRVVIGMPKNTDGSPTNATRFTSKMAMDAMITGGMKKKDRRNKGNVDKVSATIILQSYLESIP